MIKNTLMAAAVALTAGVMAIPQDADAKHKNYHDDDDDVNIQVQIGVPGYSYGQPVRRGYRLSCGQARGLLRHRGYYRINTRECNGGTYTFRASKNGRNFIVFVNSRNGNVSRG